MFDPYDQVQMRTQRLLASGARIREERAMRTAGHDVAVPGGGLATDAGRRRPGRHHRHARHEDHGAVSAGPHSRRAAQEVGLHAPACGLRSGDARRPPAPLVLFPGWERPRAVVPVNLPDAHVIERLEAFGHEVIPALA